MIAVPGRQEPDPSAPFDPRSGSRVERFLFGNRLAIALFCTVLTMLLGVMASAVRLNASFEKALPLDHPFIINYLAHQNDLKGLGNAVRVGVENPQGTIYDARYLDILRRISDDLFLIPGVDRAFMKSLWTPNTRWISVTEEGLEGGPVIPDGYDGGPASLETLRTNIARSGEIGQLVAVDARSSVIFLPLLSVVGETGKPLDYGALSRELERIRALYEAEGVRIHITGFAKVAGDLIAGMRAIFGFFLGAVAVATLVLYGYTRCVRSTALVVICSLVAVIWQLGLLPLLGIELDPHSVLVPFLVVAIGMSHGAQKMNGIMQDMGRGLDRVVAARFTFRRLFMAGLPALLCDTVGFAVLLVIRIPAIQDLAIAASVGVAALIVTNLILLPILLSFVGVSPAAARRSLKDEEADRAGAVRHPLWRFLDRFTRPPLAHATVAGAILVAVAGYGVSLGLTVGDLDPGAPELRADSRYNLDNAYMTAHYAASSDVFVVMVRTPEGRCAAYDTLMRVDALEERLSQVPGVDSTKSLARQIRQMMVGLNEGGLRWYDLPNNQTALNSITTGSPRGLYNDACSLLTVYAYLTDHRAATLARVVEEVSRFAEANNTPDATFLLAAGSAGIEAATNIVVHAANRDMLWLVYAAVIALSFVAFRSWRGVVVAILPLALTSILAETLMVTLGIGEGTWAFSPIKFQADMGVLLDFMFVLNMAGILVLLPALAYFAFPSARAGHHPAARPSEASLGA